jgi:hypothetical protein
MIYTSEIFVVTNASGPNHRLTIHLITMHKINLFFFFQHNALNDSHAQLMVHWLGEGTDVMICLARDPPLGPNDDPNSTLTTPSTSEYSVNSIFSFSFHFSFFLYSYKYKLINFNFSINYNFLQLLQFSFPTTMVTYS